MCQIWSRDKLPQKPFNGRSFTPCLLAKCQKRRSILSVSFDAFGSICFDLCLILWFILMILRDVRARLWRIKYGYKWLERLGEKIANSEMLLLVKGKSWIFDLFFTFASHGQKLFCCSLLGGNHFIFMRSSIVSSSRISSLLQLAYKMGYLPIIS